MNRPYVVVVAYAVTAASAAAAEDISRQFAADDRFLFVTQPLAATHDAIENPEFEIEASHAGELLTPAAAASVPVPPGRRRSAGSFGTTGAVCTAGSTATSGATAPRTSTSRSARRGAPSRWSGRRGTSPRPTTPRRTQAPRDQPSPPRWRSTPRPSALIRSGIEGRRSGAVLRASVKIASPNDTGGDEARAQRADDVEQTSSWFPPPGYLLQYVTTTVEQRKGIAWRPTSTAWYSAGT